MVVDSRVHKTRSGVVTFNLAHIGIFFSMKNVEVDGHIIYVKKYRLIIIGKTIGRMLYFKAPVLMYSLSTAKVRCLEV